MNIIADFLDNGEGANPGRSMETVPSKDTIVVVCVPLVVERIGSEIRLRKGCDVLSVMLSVTRYRKRVWPRQCTAKLHQG